LDERKREVNSESFLGRALEITRPATTGEYDGNTSFGPHHRGSRRGILDFPRASAIGGTTTQVRL
jgi:hypothetical protein